MVQVLVAALASTRSVERPRSHLAAPCDDGVVDARRVFYRAQSVRLLTARRRALAVVEHLASGRR